MKRRSFLSFIGLAPAAPLLPKVADAAEKVAEAVAAPVTYGGEPDSRFQSSEYSDCYSYVTSCVTAVTLSNEDIRRMTRYYSKT